MVCESNLSRKKQIISLLELAEIKNKKLLQKQYARILNNVDKILEEQRYFEEACDFINERRLMRLK